jgi:hypothetical protein
MPRGRKVTDKISEIESDLSASMFTEDNGVSKEDAPSDEPVLVEPDFDKESPVLGKVQDELDGIDQAILTIDEEFQVYAEELQAQLTQKQTQIDEEKNSLRIRAIELNGVKKYLSNELF